MSGRISRRDALAGAGAAAAAVAVAPALAIAAPPAHGPTGVEAKLERWQTLLLDALSLEQAGVSGYALIAASGVLSPRSRRAFAALRRTNRRHLREVARILDGMHVALPPDPYAPLIPGVADANTEAAALAFAEQVESQAVGVYLALLRPAAHDQVLRTFIGLGASHAQALVVIRELAGTAPVPAAFENGITPP